MVNTGREKELSHPLFPVEDTHICKLLSFDSLSGKATNHKLVPKLFRGPIGVPASSGSTQRAETGTINSVMGMTWTKIEEFNRLEPPNMDKMA